MGEAKTRKALGLAPKTKVTKASNVQVAIDHVKRMAAMTNQGGTIVMPDGFGPLVAIERNVVLDEWKKLFDEVDVNGKVVTLKGRK